MRYIKKRQSALVDINLSQTANIEYGYLTEDKQGNIYIVFHDCTSIENTLYEHLLPWLEEFGESYIPSMPWIDDDNWIWITFKDLVAYDPDLHEAAVCFNFSNERV